MSYFRDTKIVRQISEKLNTGLISDTLSHEILNEVEHKLRILIQVVFM